MSDAPYRLSVQHGGTHVYQAGGKPWWVCCDTCKEHHGPFKTQSLAIAEAQKHASHSAESKGDQP